MQKHLSNRRQLTTSRSGCRAETAASSQSPPAGMGAAPTMLSALTALALADDATRTTIARLPNASTTESAKIIMATVEHSTMRTAGAQRIVYNLRCAEPSTDIAKIQANGFTRSAPVAVTVTGVALRNTDSASPFRRITVRKPAAHSSAERVPVRTSDSAWQRGLCRRK
jgi:hypothetical protein